MRSARDTYANRITNKCKTSEYTSKNYWIAINLAYKMTYILFDHELFALRNISVRMMAPRI